MATADLIGASLRVGGTLLGGLAADNKGEFDGQIAKSNARLARIRATRATDRAQQEADKIRLENKQTIGQRRASAAARGVVVDVGSEAAGDQAVADAGHRDAMQAIIDGARARAALLQEAENQKAQAAAARQTGKGQLFGSILEAGAIVSSKWTTFAGE